MDRPIPIPCDLDQPFWDAARDHRLILQRSTASGRAQAYPRGHASDDPMDADPSMEWIEASGHGTVETFSIVHRSFYPGIPAPYVFAVVRLAEGPLLTAHIVGVAPEAVHIGMSVDVTFEAVGEKISLPCFRPAAEEDQS